MKERIAIIEGLRSPFCKAGTTLKNIQADDLGAMVSRELIQRSQLSVDDIDEVIFGNVGNPSHAANIARVIALKADIPLATPAYSVHRNCASGMEAITTAANKILAGEAEVILVGGTESMSNFPLFFNPKMAGLFEKLSRAKTPLEKIKAFSTFRPDFLKPKIAVIEGLTDPTCGLNMGQTAEVLVDDFGISRKEQDRFATESHLKAEKAQKAGIFKDEIIEIPLPPNYEKSCGSDNGIRYGQSMEALAKLKPIFRRGYGTVTAGNACPLTDGAVALLLSSESYAKKNNLKVLGYLKDYAYAGLEPQRMGMGPIHSTAKLLAKTGHSLDAIDLFEINEAFASQVLANLKAFESTDYCKNNFKTPGALGTLALEKLNVNGGAIALGHPVGATGARMVLTLLKEMNRSQKKSGIATLCIGGGQGGAVLLENEL